MHPHLELCVLSLHLKQGAPVLQEVERRTTEISEGMEHLLYRGQILELSKLERTKLEENVPVVSKLL